MLFPRPGKKHLKCILIFKNASNPVFSCQYLFEMHALKVICGKYFFLMHAISRKTIVEYMELKICYNRLLFGEKEAEGMHFA